MSDEPNFQDELMHYGILRKSGRYPWGSGGDEYTRSTSFYNYVDDMKRQGLKDKEIAEAIGLAVPDDRGFSIASLRDTRTIAKEQIVLEETNRAVTLRDKGVAIQKIADELGIPAPTVRLRLKNSENLKKSSIRQTADIIRKNVDDHKIVDVGKGTELSIEANNKLGISPERMRAALSVLRDEGYETYTLQTPQVGSNGQNTNQRVIVAPGTGFGAAKRLTADIHTMGEWSEDGGKTFFGIHPPISVNPKRMMVKFDEDGGSLEDGIIYVRPGVKDLDMGKNTYAQVRIKVGEKHFLKGMAVINRDMPDGVDLVFNTNKKRGTPILGDKNNTVLKILKDDADNPFGSMIKRQIVERGKDGKEKVTSALNIVNETGDWDDWRKSLPSQMLAKQPRSLIKEQLDVTRKNVKDRLDEINTITNAVVRKKALDSLADQIDSDAVDLRAAAMSKQLTQVIIPMPKMNKREIYAPNFETGERVVLIRYPHAGRFEIPEVTVNNNNRTAKRLLGNAKDAIGIHPSVAERLSGADFDGDTVVVIPNRGGKIKGSESMGKQAKVFDDGLSNYNPKEKYGNYEEKNGKGNFPLMKNTGKEMGQITNLITDMQVQGAQPEHVLRAVRHSMVVIDAEKHQLDYKRSAQDNNIPQLRSLYQTRVENGKTLVGGATTLLSRATSEERVPERKLRSAKNGGAVDPETGALRFEETGRTQSAYDPKTQTYNPDVQVPRVSKVKRLALTGDADDLVRDKADPVERLYADHVNDMKAMANTARLRSLRTANPKRNPQAAQAYKPEVDKLVADLNAVIRQKPLDRRAQIIAGATVKQKRLENPLLRTDRDALKKVERQAITAARSRLGLTKPIIEITDRQWDAIQAGAISSSRLSDILDNADPKRVAELSMPRTNTVMTTAVSARAKAMLAAGATTADVAASLGISASTLREAVARGDA